MYEAGTFYRGNHNGSRWDFEIPAFPVHSLLQIMPLYTVNIYNVTYLFPCCRGLLSSADKLCKQSGPRSGPTKRQAWSGSKLFDTLMVFLKDLFEKVNFQNNPQMTKSMQNYPACKELYVLQQKGHTNLSDWSILVPDSLFTKIMENWARLFKTNDVVS